MVKVLAAGGALFLVFALAASGAVGHAAATRSEWAGVPGDLVVAARGGVWTMNLEGRLAARAFPGRHDYLSAVRASQDGKRFLVATDGRLASGDIALYLVTCAGRWTRLVQDGNAPAWMPNVRGFAYALNGLSEGCGLWYATVKLRPRVGDPTERVLASRRRGCESDDSPTFSPKGDRIAFARWSRAARSIYVYELESRRLTRLTGGTSPSWSPDGRSIAFYRDAAIRTIDLRSGRITRLAPGGSEFSTLVWSPDSRSIAFTNYTEPELLDRGRRHCD